MTSFAPTLIAPAPCRPIPLVRNSRHQHHTSRYARLSISSTSSRRSSGGSHHKHSQSGSIGSDAAFGFTLSSTASATSPPPVSALAPPQSAMLTPLQEVQRFDPSAPTATPRIDHDLTPTRKNMQAYSSTLSSQPVNPASPPSSALASPFLAVPLPSSTSSSNNISQTPSSNSHPTLIPPSPIPRRLTRNPFVRSLSQQHTVTTNTVQLGLGLGFGSDSQHIGQDPTTPTQPTHSSADPFLLRPSLQEDEPAHRFSMDNIGIGLMEIDFDLDNFSADDGGRELLRVERERRKRSFEMHS